MYKLIRMASEWLKKYTFDAQKNYTNNQNTTNYKKTRIIEDLTNKDRLKLYYEYIKKFLNHNTDKIKNFKTKAFNTIKINDLNLEGLHNYLNNNLDNFRKQYEFLRKNNLYTQEKTKEFLKIKRKNK